MPRFFFSCIIALFLVSGCAHVEPLPFRDSSVNAAWPLPPNPPRIQFLRAINSPSEIFPSQTKAGYYYELLTGEKNRLIDLVMPFGVTGDGESVIYIADMGTGVIHRYDLSAREVSYIYQAGEEELSSPAGLAVDSNRSLYVTDSVNAKLYKFGSNGQFIKEITPTPPFQRPAGIAINNRNEKYVVDVLAHKLLVFDKDDRFIGEFPKIKQGEELNFPSNVAVDGDGNVYVTDSFNFKIKVYDHEGELKQSIGQIGDSPGSFTRPKGVAVDSDRHIYVVDAGMDNFQVFNKEGNLLISIGKNGEGPGEFYLPSGIFIDKNDRIFIADSYNRRIQLFQYLKEGVQK